MIQLSSAGKRFGPKLLFQDLDWLITSMSASDWWAPTVPANPRC